MYRSKSEAHVESCFGSIHIPLGKTSSALMVGGIARPFVVACEKDIHHVDCCIICVPAGLSSTNLGR